MKVFYIIIWAIIGILGLVRCIEGTPYSGGMTYRGHSAMIIDFVRWLSEEVEVEDGNINRCF